MTKEREREIRRYFRRKRWERRFGRLEERLLWFWTLLFKRGDIVAVDKVPLDDRCHLQPGDTGRVVDFRGRNGWIWVNFFRVQETQCMRPWEIRKVA